MLASTGTWAIRVHFDNRTVYIRFKVHLQQDEKRKNTTVGQFTVFPSPTTFSNPSIPHLDPRF